ncbi:hypothetical protein GCM10020331_015240 [Ectobacillus funiculus]
MRVPEDIAVVGFDNIKMTSVFEPNITTIDQPKYEIGKKGHGFITKSDERGNVTEEKKFVLKDELIIRESSGFKRI